MNSDAISIAAPGVDTEAIVASLREQVAEQLRTGYYTDPRIARAEKNNLFQMTGEDEFLDFYLDCLREAVLVDINDFEIRERRRGLGPLLIAIKRGAWNLLKFYTYRLWSQQNQVNSLLLSATEELDRKYRARLLTLEARVKALEQAAADQP